MGTPAADVVQEAMTVTAAAAVATVVGSAGRVTARTGGFRLRHPLLVQLVRYAVVGGLATAANAILFLLLRNWFDTLAANLVALVLSTALSTEINRRFTFGGVHGHRFRAHVQTGGTVVFYAVYSSLVLMTLELVVTDPRPVVQSSVVAAASVLGGLARFAVLRFWVFATDRAVRPAHRSTSAALVPACR